MQVVIIPPPRLRGIYDDNRVWARQFVAADPQARAVVEMTGPGADAVVEATERAATLAGAEGWVIYAVGHGGAGGEGHPEAGQADLAPRRGLRVTQFVAYYDAATPWAAATGEALRPIRQMDEDLRAAQAVAGRRARRDAERGWCTTYVVDPHAGCGQALAQMRDRSRVQPYYDRVAQTFRTRPVRRVVLLTCNVGSAVAFLDELSTDFPVPVAAYTRRVMSRWERRGGQTRVWMFLDGDAEGDGTNTDAALTELMRGAGRGDLRVGRVRPPAAPRR